MKMIDLGPRDVSTSSLLRVSVPACQSAVCLTRIEGRVYAFEDRCPHRGTALSQGVLNRGVVECPRHGWRFDVRTGTRVDGLATARLQQYSVREMADGTLRIYPRLQFRLLQWLKTHVYKSQDRVARTRGRPNL